MKQLIDLYWTIQTFINNNEFAFIPLDIWAHVIVAALITIALLRFKVSPLSVLFIVFVIAILKEGIDWQFQVKISMEESFKDITVTMLYPAIAYLIRRRKNV